MSRLQALIIAGLTVTAPAAAYGQGDTAAVRVAITAQAQKYTTAALAGDAVTIATLFTEDARAEYAGFPSAVGRAAIQALYEGFFKANKIKVWEDTIRQVNAPSADIVSAGGNVHSFAEENGKPVHAWWRYSAAYKKGADGLYRIAYIMAFPDSTK
jgi:ketosteroid isomerase-like protein